MGILLYIFAQTLEYILAIVFGLLTILYYIFTLKWRSGLLAINKYYHHRALAKDQYGNVRFKLWMNLWMSKDYDKPYYFGDEDDTISYATAMNYFKNFWNIKGLLKFVGNILNKVDPNHLEKAINNKIERDIEALDRLKAAGLISSIILSPVVKDDDYLKYVKHVTNKPR